MKVAFSSSILFLGLLTAVSVAGQPKDANLQTPRQALVEMLSGSQEKLDRHLTVPVQEPFKALLKNSPAGTPDPIQAMLISATANGKRS